LTVLHFDGPHTLQHRLLPVFPPSQPSSGLPLTSILFDASGALLNLGSEIPRFFSTTLIPSGESERLSVETALPSPLPVDPHLGHVFPRSFS